MKTYIVPGLNIGDDSAELVYSGDALNLSLNGRMLATATGYTPGPHAFIPGDFGAFLENALDSAPDDDSREAWTFHAPETDLRRWADACTLMELAQLGD
jgi:hypothetical protein